ncbi:MAG: hypothetical protein ACYTKD_12415 [Planctomycetota bacterium]
MSIGKLKGYSLDPVSRRRWLWRPSTFVLGAVLLGGAGAFLYYGFVAKEAEERGVAIVGAFAAMMVAGLLIAFLQRKARCAGCGGWMVPMHLDIPDRERGLLHRLGGGSGDKDVLYQRHDHVPYRIMAKLFVCHECKEFFVASKRMPRKVDDGDEGVERQREFRRKKRRLERDGVFDEVRKKRGHGRAG